MKDHIKAVINCWQNRSIPYRSITIQDLSDLDVDLSRSFNVKCHGVIGVAIHVYGFLLMVT